MKIAICEFQQETNSFNPVPSTRAEYAINGIWKGAEILEQAHFSSELGGMIDTLKSAGADIVPTYRMFANSGGPVSTDVVDEFMQNTTEILKQELPLDGVCLSFHGATQSLSSDDVCGDITEAIRNIIGENAVISISVDLHANVTEKMAVNADYISGYHTYPHVDFYETGARAANLCIRKIKNRSTAPVMIRSAVPMIVPASASNTETGPFAELMKYAHSLVETGQIIDFSIFNMQPWLDVKDAGSAILVISNNTDDIHSGILAEKLLAIRHDLKNDLASIDSIIKEAELNYSGKPYVLVDSADSTNAGACGDSAAVLERIIALDSDIKAGIFLSDRDAAEHAFEVGVGNTATFTLGAKIAPEMSKPVTVKAKVRSLHDGIYEQEGPAMRGWINNIGKTAVLAVKNAEVLVTENLLGPGDLQLYRHHGIEPAMKQLIAVKACSSYKAGYLPIAEKAIEADTPGSATANLLSLPFKKLPERFYPMAEISESDIERPQIFRK